MVPCEQPSQAAKDRCLDFQKQFMNSYELSCFGVTFFIGDLEGFLDPRGESSERVDVTGVRADLIEASAWRYLRWKVAKPGELQDRYKAAWQRTAAELTPDQVEATKRRIPEIVDLMKAQSYPPRPDLVRLRDRWQPTEGLTSQLEDYAR